MGSRFLAVAAVVISAVAITAPAAAATITVSPSNLNGWQQVNSGTSSGQFESGPATPPLGTGSYELNVGADGNGAAQLRSTNQHLQRLDELTALGYSTYTDQDGSGGQSPYILLNVDYNNDLVRDDFLFFEPVYQDATFFPSNPQPSLVDNLWQTWDALNGGWWSANNTAGAGPGTNVKSLSAILAVEPNARILDTGGLGGFRLVAGFGAGAWDNYIGNADNVTVGVNGVSTTYDFEAAAPVPLPMAAWAGLSLIGGVGGFKSIRRRFRRAQD
jgi:hypothetical protein